MSVVEVLPIPQSPACYQLHKFGGSSLANAECFLRVIEILKLHTNPNDLIVVSAAGKTTNQLIEWLEQVNAPISASTCLERLHRYQQSLIDTTLNGTTHLSVSLPDPLVQLQKTLYKQLTVSLAEDILSIERSFTSAVDELQNRKRLPDPVQAWVLGFGEVWSARLLSALLCWHQMPAVDVDSRHFLCAESGALPEINTIDSLPKLKKILAEHQGHRFVITGFMAQNTNGETVLLGRNGSDYSATAIGTLAGVNRVTIWSDVAGVHSADPRYVKNAFLLPLIHIDEAAELARLYASVLHNRTLQPISKNKTDLVLRSSHTPHQGSTCIVRNADRTSNAIVTSLNNVYLLQLEFPSKHDFLAVTKKVIHLLEKEKALPLTYCLLEERHILQLAYTSELANNALELLQDFGVPAKMRLRDGFSLIALVGRHITENTYYCRQFYQQLAGQPVQFFSESDHKLSLVALLRKTQCISLVECVHRKLFDADQPLITAEMMM